MRIAADITNSGRSETFSVNMINLSGGDQQHSRTQALIVITDNANKILADRDAAMKMKEDSLVAMTALGWPPKVVKAIGGRPLNKIFQRSRDEVFDRGGYILFRDMIIFATDAGVPIGHAQ